MSVYACVHACVCVRACVHDVRHVMLNVRDHVTCNVIVL